LLKTNATYPGKSQANVVAFYSLGILQLWCNFWRLGQSNSDFNFNSEIDFDVNFTY